MKLKEMMKHFFLLYGRRNRIFLPSLRDRIDFLNLGIGDLEEAIRKEVSIQYFNIALARIVARIFCITEHFQELPLVEFMARKYPSRYCSYCHQFPCQCPEKRPDAKLAESISDEQLDWSLKRWSFHLAALYGDRNRAKGIENILNRLFKEISELLSLEMRISHLAGSLDEIEKEFALELSDALAWTIAVANFFEIDLEEAVLERYGRDCWNCHFIPCRCTIFNLEPVKWPTERR